VSYFGNFRQNFDVKVCYMFYSQSYFITMLQSLYNVYYTNPAWYCVSNLYFSPQNAMMFYLFASII